MENQWLYPWVRVQIHGKVTRLLIRFFWIPGDSGTGHDPKGPISILTFLDAENSIHFYFTPLFNFYFPFRHYSNKPDIIRKTRTLPLIMLHYQNFRNPSRGKCSTFFFHFFFQVHIKSKIAKGILEHGIACVWICRFIGNGIDRVLFSEHLVEGAIQNSWQGSIYVEIYETLWESTQP